MLSLLSYRNVNGLFVKAQLASCSSNMMIMYKERQGEAPQKRQKLVHHVLRYSCLASGIGNLQEQQPP